MARGTLLTKQVKCLISTAYMKHPTWGATRIRKEVVGLLHDDPTADPDWPGVSAVYKILRRLREADEARSPESRELDSPWSVVSLTKYDIPPEALPLVMEMSAHFPQREGRPITIREAKWVVRFSEVDDLGKLADFALAYAEMERVIELVGQDMLEAVVDSELYIALTGKTLNEPVFYPSRSLSHKPPF